MLGVIPFSVTCHIDGLTRLRNSLSDPESMNLLSTKLNYVEIACAAVRRTSCISYELSWSVVICFSMNNNLVSNSVLK